jgi:proteasome accessory factor A
MSNRIFGIETEFGCLTPSDRSFGPPEAVAARVKNHIFKNQRLGVLDMHYRDWGEPPGNGGFLYNGGRLYIDMGHLEYATAECRNLFELIAQDKAAEWMIINTLERLGIREEVSFFKNNIDHFTGATFGCHENYLVRRNVPFYEVVIPKLLPFFVTRQIFAGTGRVGCYEEGLWGLDDDDEYNGPRLVDFQISQRADHIVTEIYEWIQFSRAIINTRDEPLADYNKYRRLHLLVGDTNMSEYATALKIGTTSLVLDLIERKRPLKNLCLFDHVSAIKHISRDQSLKWIVELESGRTISAIDLQREYLIPAQKYLKGKDEETDWILAQWEQVLDALERDHTSLTDKIDWVAKKWLLQTFMESERLKWGDPWLESLDLEYHNIDQRKGLYYELERKGAMQRVTTDNQIQNAIKSSPKNTRAKARVHIMRELFRRKIHHIVDWDLIHSNFGESFDMKDPFETYDNEVSSFLKRLSKTPSRPPGTPEAKRSRRY